MRFAIFAIVLSIGPVLALTIVVGFPLVCSATVFDKLDDRVGFVRLGARAIKGHQPVEVYGWRPDNAAVSGPEANPR